MISRRAFLSLAGASALARPSFAFRSTQSAPAIDAARLRNRLERLSYHGRPPGGTFADGVNRVAYSVADLTARAWIIDEIKGMDVVPRIDAAGNIFARFGVAVWAAIIRAGSRCLLRLMMKRARGQRLLKKRCSKSECRPGMR